MKVTVLTENTSSHGLPFEHGLSLYIETKDLRILFDAGQSGLFAENAERLGIDLRKVDFAVISHGHYDHGGGIRRFTEINPSAPVYLNKHAFEAHFNAEGKDIGLDPGLRDSARIITVDGYTVIREGVSIHPASEIPITLDMGAAGLGMIKSGRIVPDDFRHEQYLLICESGKKILFSGCAHKGIINIVDHFKPDVVFGGFHFMKTPPGNILRGYAQKLDSYGSAYYTCHCTGLEQYSYIKPIIKRLNYICVGDIIDI